MSVPYSTARLLAPFSFAIDFAAQQYGLLTTPSMLAIHLANLSFFSPAPVLIGAFTLPHQLLQLAWLHRLLTRAGSPDGLALMTSYAPVFAVANLCVGAWVFAWTAGALKLANLFVVLNAVVHLAYVATRLPRLDTRDTSALLTHLVAKGFAGLAVLDVLHNTSAAYARDAVPGAVVRVLTAVGFVAAAGVCDWILGGVLVFDLVALAVGQGGRDGGWATELAVLTGVVAGVVGVRNWVRPPYGSAEGGYERVGGGDEGDGEDGEDGGERRV